MDPPGVRSVLHGSVELRSPWFSNRWELRTAAGVVAELERHPRRHCSTVRFPDGTRWLVEPHGWGVVRILGDEGELARVTRRSWWGRRWELGSAVWAYELLSDPRPRRWHIAVGGTSVARLSGSLVSYNRIDVEASLAVPVAALVLSWYVVARPWEAATRPSDLVPAPIPGAPRPAAGAT